MLFFRFALSILSALLKELHLQASPFATVLGRVILGPAISLFLSGFIYFGIFSSNPNLILKGLSRENYLAFLAVGFVFQNAIHTGFFSFSQRIIGEISGKTFSVIWLSGPQRAVHLLMLGSVDNLRSVAFGCLALWVGKVSFPSYTGLFYFWFWFFGAVVVGWLLGTLRVFVHLLARDWLDLLDGLYLFFSFGSCAFIPISLLPEAFLPLVKINGLYWCLEVGRGIVLSSTDLMAVSAALSTMIGLFIILWLTWNMYKIRLMDKCFC